MSLVPPSPARGFRPGHWLRRYRRADLPADLLAGLTTAVMLVPQAMAYAMLAGLPPIVGLYASLLPLLAYALLGSSRQLAVGPVAMDSLLVAQGLAPFAALGGEVYVAYAAGLALLVGALHVLMGVFRLGFLVNFLSQPVMAGFTSAAALIIASSQLSHVLGVSLPRGAVWEVAGAALGELAAWHGATLVIALGATGLLVALKRWAPRVPRALVVVVLGTLAVRVLGLEAEGVAVVGAIPEGLPALRVPDVDAETLAGLIGVAGPIALVAVMEAMSVGKAVAQRLGYDIVPNRELFALGAANVASGLSQGYPITGGFSRTAVNASAGARTPLAGVITAGVVGLTLLFLTPLFHDLPKAVLAAIIMTAVIGLVDLAQARRLWRVARPELALMALTFAATLGLGIGEGILVGVGASLATFVMGTTRPHVAVL
ncbi:MAG: SulP family inorganic anion transporter, partial [Myxococcota bacterium]